MCFILLMCALISHVESSLAAGLNNQQRIKSLILVEALIRIIQYEGVLTAGGDLYGCSTGSGSEGEEEEEEG